MDLEPSKTNYLRYDAQTYEKEGFLEVKGRVQELAQKPRFWQMTVKATTLDPETGVLDRREFKFRPVERFRLSELAPIVNDKIHESEDYLPKCVSVMVCARIMEPVKKRKRR